MKAQLRELSSLYASSHSEADLERVRQQHRSALTSRDTEHRTALANLDGKHQSALRDLKQHSASIEDLRARLARLESEHRELQSEYSKAVDLSRNQQAALTKTREELNMARAHITRLEEQLQDASLQQDTGDVSHSSVSSSRNDQAALVIRDLRAQIVILEEELKDNRHQVMTLKKQVLTKG